MSEKLHEKLHIPERQEEISHPEDHENFEGQRILIIGGPDGHGISMAVTSAQYLEKRGAETMIYSGSPVIREGRGATHPAALYSKTLPNFKVEGFDRVVITDIPLDFKNLKTSEKRLIELTARLDKDRERRKLPKIQKPVFFLDHHSTTAFEESWVSEDTRQTSPPKNVESHGVIIKTVPKAEFCRLGHEPSKIARIGAIADRDSAVLPVSEEEMLLAKGLDAAVRPDSRDPRPALPKNTNQEKQENLTAWEDRAQARLEEAVRRLLIEDWDYFRREAERLPRIEIPTTSGFGKIAMVDTQDLTGKFTVFKLMEMAVENQGIGKTPYAIGVLRDLSDSKMGRERGDIISVIRHWTREDLPSVETIITQVFGKEFIDKHKIYGAENAKTMRLAVNDHDTAEITSRLVEAFAGREMPDFSEVRSVVMCGDPNSGKSVLSTIFREALKNLGVKVDHLDLDKAAPTPQWYLEAEVAYKEAEFLFSQGNLSEEKLSETRRKLEEAATKRQALKRPWSIELAEEAKQELILATDSVGKDFIIGDIGGGKIKKDAEGKIIKITRLTAENARILEGTSSVIIVSNNLAGAAEWKRLIESGEDPETGVRINRKTPIKILGVYQSILEGTTQKVPEARDESGVITNLDRSKSERKYNPSAFVTALFVSEAVKKRKGEVAK